LPDWVGISNSGGQLDGKRKRKSVEFGGGKATKLAGGGVSGVNKQNGTMKGFG